MYPGTSDTKAVYENVNTGPMRTTLTRENKYPEVGQVEVGGFFADAEQDTDLERTSYGAYGRLGVWEFATVQAEVPFVDADFGDESNSGIGDVVLSLDLLAYQDLFAFPFVIPHIDVSLPTGDEDEGLGTGETVTTIGLSIGTKVYDVLTYVVDVAYALNGGGLAQEDDNIVLVSGSIVWDITDRFAVLAEGRVEEKNVFDNYPYIIKGGLVYRFTRDLQLAGYGGTYSAELEGAEDDQFDLVEIRLAYQF